MYNFKIGDIVTPINPDLYIKEIEFSVIEKIETDNNGILNTLIKSLSNLVDWWININEIRLITIEELRQLNLEKLVKNKAITPLQYLECKYKLETDKDVAQTQTNRNR